MLTNEYLKRVYEGLEKRNANEPEFLQAVREVLESIQPVVEKHPEYDEGRSDRAPGRAGAHHHLPCALGRRCQGKVQVNRGYRVAVQQRHRPLQGRPALPSLCQSGHPEVPRL